MAAYFKSLGGRAQSAKICEYRQNDIIEGKLRIGSRRLMLLAMLAVLLLATSQSKSLDAGVYENKIIINEIYPNPEGDDNNDDAVSWERVELKNVGSAAVNVGLWTIKDDDRPYTLATIPKDTTIAPCGYLVVNIRGTTGGISNAGDPVILCNLAGEEMDRVDCPSSSGSKEGRSYSCMPDASDNWKFWGVPTFGGSLSLENLPGAPNMVQKDYGDAPDSYKTLRASDGASHIVTCLYLGSGIDSEPDGQPGANADGDGADEDGATFSGSIIVGTSSTLTVTASAAGVLQAWLDFNGDGDFEDSGEHIASDHSLTAGEQTISFSVPANAKVGYTYARLRFSSASGLASYGSASDGEVEDYRVEIKYGLGDFVWEDQDGDGLQDDGEPGMSGVTVNLRDTGDNIVSSQTTLADGKYLFINPTPGRCTLEFLLPGYGITSKDVDPDDTKDSDADPATHRTVPVTVVQGQSDLTWDAGFYHPVSISGLKFHDNNANGLREADERLLSGWDIQLKDSSDKLLQTAKTSSDPGKEGTYEFMNLQPGSYRVYEVQKLGWVRTVPAEEYYTITLTNMPSRENIFGNNQLAISGTKFHDRNANGQKEDDEPSLLGEDIQLKDSSGILLQTVKTSSDPGKEGTYEFLDLQPGTYRVYEVQKSGWVRTAPAEEYYTITLTNMPSRGNIFGSDLVKISGVKFEDQNGNGARDGGEPGLAGWTTKLKKGIIEVASTQTLADGSYSFTGIVPGSYTVEEVAQDGWTQSYPASPGTHTLTLALGEAGPNNIDFGNWRATGFSGMKFEDLNGNSIKDPDEPGLEGWTIKLKKDGTEIASTKTAADGAYSFTGIVPGSYTVEEEVQDGWTQSYPASPGTYPVKLVSGVAGPTDLNFGNLWTTGFSGMKFEDLNGNGAKDRGEPGLAGWTIKLKKGATEVASTKTLADGAYSFTGIVPGSYTVEEVAQDGWTQSYPASPGTQAVTLVSGVAGPVDINFGNWRTTGFSGIKFEDSNGNGARDSGEPGLAGWTIKLKKGATEVASTKTLADGAYSFTGIVPGSYTVEEVAQDGWTQSYPTSPGTQAVTLVSGVAGPTDINFGNWRTTGFSGMKFEDLNGNGARDIDEPGLAGWTIKLKKDGTEVASTQTLADGAYSFTGIVPGSYTVEEVAQDGWTQSYPTSPGTQAVTLVSGVAGPTDINFGNWRTTGFSGMKFEDLNGNGARDIDEPGLAGWTIKLKKDGTEVASTQTLADGAYSFTGIVPGSYTVEEVAQDGWTQSYPTSPGTQAVTLVSGVAGPTDINFGNWRTTGFSGMKFEDLNGNGARDIDEPGLAGWTIKLKKDGTEVASTQTLADGAYSFTGIVPGSYTVEEVAQDGWTQSYPASPGTQTVTLASGVAGPTNINFGNLRTTGFSGMKFEDLNGNGARDIDEPGLAGWTIKLKKDGTEVASTLTAADGSYSFTDIVPGSYTVEEVAQDGWIQSYPASPGTQSVTLVSGVAGRTDINFGNLRTTGFSGMKFEDLNGNRARDTGEPGLAGWTIKLKKGATEVARTQTLADGSYSFTGIVPGSYTVEEVAQDGWIQTYPASGTHPVTMASGVAGPKDIDFGNWHTTGLAGTKFEDLNGNGAKDSGEPGLEGWSIRLMKDGTEIAGTQTAADGTYSFADIAPGRYTVVEKAQTGWTQTSPSGNAYTAVSNSGQVTVTNADQSEVASTEVNFGNRRLVEAFQVQVTADPQTAQPGQEIVFTITINRQGDILLNSLSAEYTLPKGLKFVSSNPSPQSVIENADGTTTLIWKGLSLGALIAAQAAEAQSPSTTINLITQVQSDAPESLTSTVVVTGSASEATIAKAMAEVSVKVDKSLAQPILLNKTSDLKEVWPGATVGYTITYQSLVDIPLTGVVITEQASSDLIFLSATPAPDAGTENVWSIGDLPPKEKGTINVLFQVKNASNLSFESQSSVSGSGFVNSYRRLSTETQSSGLKNSVTLTYYGQIAPISTSYFAKLRDSEGTSLLQKEHGSGEYRNEEATALQMKNRSIRTEGSLKAVYRPTTFSLPGDKSINYDSEISSLTRTRNRATQASTRQEIRYARSLEMDQQLLVDKNETIMAVEAELQGEAILGVLKKESAAVKPSPIFESSQDYAGTFRFNSSLQDYGGNVRLTRNATGQGQAASDQRLKKSQRSYEHGSGSYESEELVSTAESYMARDLSVSYDPQYGYGKWKAGIWSRSSGTSFLGQEISGADYIREETKAAGLSDMSTNLSFQGKARLRAVSKNVLSEVDLDEEYAGEYSLQRTVHLGGVSRFDRPHLTLNKTGRLVPGTVAADYTITVLNDGNAALGPVYVWDTFPAGTDYLSSSQKPDRLHPGYANWSLLYLSIGQSVNINLRLNVTDPGEELVNVVYASGGHNGEWVTAGNMSVMQFGWLSCCLPKMLVEKQARIDAADNRLIWYRILLKNQANVSLLAQVKDRLPTGLQLLNASAEPQVQGQNLLWVTTAIPAGESRFIEYLAQATQNGKFVNTARIEAHALDGSGGSSAAASATVTIGEATSNAEDGWRPPEWGLDRSEKICDEGIAGEEASCSCPLEGD